MTDLITRTVEIPSPAGMLPCYLAQPTYPGPYRAVVVVHDQPGLVSHPMELARRLARFGLVAAAPDLYRGGPPVELSRHSTVEDILACARYLNTVDRVLPRWFGMLALGIGGSYAMAASARSAEFAALVTLYAPPLDETDIARMQAPLLAMFAENDPGTPPDVVHQTRALLERYAIPHEVKVYSGLTHNFLDIAEQAAYDEACARDAWDKSLQWVRTHLG